MNVRVLIFLICLILSGCKQPNKEITVVGVEKQKPVIESVAKVDTVVKQENTNNTLIKFKHTATKIYKDISYSSLTEIDYFAGFVSYMGVMLGAVNDEFDLSLSYYIKEDNHVFVLSKKTGNEDSHAIFEALDIIEIEKVPENYRFCIRDCLLNNVHDGELVAIYEPDSSSELSKAIKAWRVDYKECKIYEIDAKNVMCYHMIGEN